MEVDFRFPFFSGISVAQAARPAAACPESVYLLCPCSLCRVMAFVQKAVARLNEPEKLQTLVRDLGRKHVGYGAKRRYVDVSIPARP